ncbi:MAG: hypothetical protein QM770_15305 [Tepidisphaeraceae bacterium]
MRKGWMNTGLLTIAVAGVSMFAAGCGGGHSADAAKDVAKNYIEAAKAGDFTKIKSFYNKGYQTAFDSFVAPQAMKGIIGTMKENLTRRHDRRLSRDRRRTNVHRRQGRRTAALQSGSGRQVQRQGYEDEA